MFNCFLASLFCLPLTSTSCLCTSEGRTRKESVLERLTKKIQKCKVRYLVSRLFIESGPWTLTLKARVAQEGFPQAVPERLSP